MLFSFYLLTFQHNSLLWNTKVLGKSCGNLSDNNINLNYEFLFHTKIILVYFYCITFFIILPKNSKENKLFSKLNEFLFFKMLRCRHFALMKSERKIIWFRFWYFKLKNVTNVNHFEDRRGWM